VDATNRLRTWAQVMRNWPGSLTGVTKAELRAAIDATDDWIEANQTSFNTALPQPFRGAATTPQKTFLLCYVAMRRAGLLRAEED
jgi:hypothetical protein